MKTILATAACVLMLSTSLAAAQSSMGKGGAAQTGESADPAKTPGGANQGKMGNNSMRSNGNVGTTGIAPGNAGMGGANKNGDGQMTKGGTNR
jgi:hypothetical protein